jgi:hypothetical protein
LAVSAGRYPTGKRSRGFTIDPTGEFINAANWHSQSIFGFTIDLSNGALAEITGPPFAAGPAFEKRAYRHVRSICVRFQQSFNDISVDAIVPETGAFKPLTGSRVKTGPNPRTTVLSRSYLRTGI